MKTKSRRGSSLVFLGFSIIAFVISYGLMWMLVPMILGVFFSTQPAISDPAWAQTYTDTKNVIRWLIPLVPTIGIFILVIKVFMVATVKGRD